LTRSVFPLAALALLVVALGGCELLKKDGESLAIINNRVLGMPAGDFFDRYGRARSRVEVADQTTEYDWISSVPAAKAGPDSLDERVCRLRLTSDARGRISAVQVRYDAPGLKSTSRCGEIFAAP
jgi:hypothetical protein